MINVTALNILLTDNSDGKIFRRWLITTPSGTLIAYTTPAEIRELRDQAALVLVTWREQADVLAANSSDSISEAATRLRSLSIEFDNRNILIREIQPKLLLVLEGGVPPGRSRKLQITAESADGVVHSVDSHPNGISTPRAGSPTGHSEVSTTYSTRQRRMSLLDIQRRKLNALADVITAEFDKVHFAMPADLDDRLY